MNGPGLTNQTTFIDIAQWGTGVFVVHVVYDTTPNVTDHYTGTASAVPVIPVPPPPAPQDRSARRHRRKNNYRRHANHSYLRTLDHVRGPYVHQRAGRQLLPTCHIHRGRQWAGSNS